jgi:hypothetical protein
LSDKEITNFQKQINQEENIKEEDDDETIVEITKKETRIVLEKMKEAVQKYGDYDTFQLFQKLQVQCIYIIINIECLILPSNILISG